MSFTFKCTHCGKPYRGDEKIAGKRMKCQKCGTVLRVPSSSGRQETKSPSPGSGVSAGATKGSVPQTPSSRSPASHAPAERVTCPHCKSSCRIQPEWRGRSIHCPSCNKPFTAPLATARPKGTGQAREPVPEFVPDDSPQDSEFFVADDGGAPLYDVVEESPAAQELPPPVPTRTRPKKSKPGGAFGEWIRGQGLWILDGVGLALLVVITFLKMPDAPPGASSGAFVAGSVVGMICAFVIFLPLGLAIGAVVLRLACRLCQVETPNFLPCMGIVMLIGMINALINQLVGLMLNVDDPQNLSLGTAVASLVISIAVGAAASIPVLIVTLEVSAGRAALVWLIEMVLMLVIIFVLVLIIVGIALALGFPQAFQGPGPAGQPQMMPNPGQQFPGNPMGPGQQFPGMPQGPGQQIPGRPSGPGQGYPGMQQPGQPGGPPAAGPQNPSGPPGR
jgi:hypothetical protein